SLHNVPVTKKLKPDEPLVQKEVQDMPCEPSTFGLPAIHSKTQSSTMPLKKNKNTQTKVKGRNVDVIVIGSTATGIKKGRATKLFSIMDIPRFYRKLENDVGKVWEMQLHSEMKKAAEEERKLAIEARDVEKSILFRWRMS
ncbi:hypothetical protein ILUMI_19827, partial [Ignelater luminosus]